MKELMSDAEIRRRKKVQGTISRTTATLGLTALGAKGAAVGAKRIGRFSHLVPKLNNASTTLTTMGAGIGGAGGYNFARYTDAESRKRKQVIKAKSAPAQMAKTIQTASELNTSRTVAGMKEQVKGRLTKVAKNEPVFKAYDPERNRMRRMDRYSAASNMAAGAAGVGAGIHARKAVGSPIHEFQRPKPRATPVKVQVGYNGLRSKDLPGFKAGLKSAGKSGLLAATAITAAVGAKKIQNHKSRRGGSFTPIQRPSY